MTTQPLLIGKRVQLNPILDSDLGVLTSWLQDSDTLRALDSVPAYPRTEEALLAWIKKSQTPVNDYLFAIRLLEDDKIIGYIELDGIQWTNGSCSASYIIGDSAHRKQGFAYEALQLGLKFVFHELNLYRISLTIFEYNLASINLAKKLGFQHEGTHREFLQRDGKRFDMYLYGLLFPEWAALNNND